jgi:hypothetical protein
MESSRTFALHAFCTWLYSTRKKNFNKKASGKKIVHDPYVFDGPLPPALPGATQRMPPAMAPAGGPAAQPLGHLGHLGHGFLLQAGAGGRWPLGHLGHLFCITKVTQKLAPARAAGLILWVIWVILSRDKNRRG